MGLFLRGVVGGGGGGREGGSERPSGLVLVLLVDPGGVGAGVEFMLKMVALTSSSEGVTLSVASPDGGRVGGGGSCRCGGFLRVVYPSLLWLLLLWVLLPLLLLLLLVLLVLLRLLVLMFKLGGFGAGGSEASMGIPRSALTAVLLC